MGLHTCRAGAANDYGGYIGADNWFRVEGSGSGVGTLRPTMAIAK